jgi:hypothetical protein
MSGRIELKYLVDHRQRAELLRCWRPFVAPAPFTDGRATYPILSLYFDTPSLLFYDEKLDGEMLRTKVRLRGYGTRLEDLSPLFLEIKRKIDSRVVKYRHRFERWTPELASPGAWPLDADAEGAQIAQALHRYRLRPVVQVLYQREAYESDQVRTLRIAFDSQLYAFGPEQRFGRGMIDDPRHRCLGDTQFIVEIKSDGRLPSWVQQGIQAAELQQRAISKYVVGVEKLGLPRRETGVYA